MRTRSRCTQVRWEEESPSDCRLQSRGFSDRQRYAPHVGAARGRWCGGRRKLVRCDPQSIEGLDQWSVRTSWLLHQCGNRGLSDRGEVRRALLKERCECFLGFGRAHARSELVGLPFSCLLKLVAEG